MKIAIMQIENKQGDIEFNKKKALSALARLKGHNIDMAVFPELFIPGYCAMDFFLEEAFIKQNLAALSEISKKAFVPVAIGFIDFRHGKAYNAAALLYNGRTEFVVHKQKLPEYDIFYEKRYFREGSYSEPFVIAGRKVAIQICEDMWPESYEKKNYAKRYNMQGSKSREAIGFQPKEPGKSNSAELSTITKKLITSGAEIIINLSASPFTLEKLKARKKIISDAVHFGKAGFLYVNSVSAADGYDGFIVFDGSSMAYSADSGLFLELPGFRECMAVADFKNSRGYILDSFGKFDGCRSLNSGSPDNADKSQKEECLKKGSGITGIKPAAAKNSSLTDNSFSRAFAAYDAIVYGIRKFFSLAGFKKAVVGLSGGIDSAVTAALVSEALGSENLYAFMLPSRFTSCSSIEDAENLARGIGCFFNVISIESSLAQLELAMKAYDDAKSATVAYQNLQARIRATILMFYANKLNSLLVSCSNKTELSYGYGTLYGDIAGALMPIGDLTKDMVYELAEAINLKAGRDIISRKILEKKPTAELKPGQEDESELGLSYSILSGFAESMLSNSYSFDTAYSEFLNASQSPLLQNSKKANAAELKTAENRKKAGKLSYDGLIENNSSAQTNGKTLKSIDKKALQKLFLLLRKSEFKRRQAPPVIKLSDKSFGIGRRIPMF